MYHQLKTNIFKILEWLPTQTGDYLYHKSQQLIDTLSIEERINICYESYKKTVDVLNENKIQLEGTKIIEIGSGWLPIMPYMFLFLGKAKEIHTFDINKHYKKKFINRLNEAFIDRFGNLELDINKETFLPNKIKYHPKTDISHYNFDGELIDLVFSRYVLEHVYPITMRSIHIGLRKNLRNVGNIFHMISPCDHRAYNDSSISLYDFLRYSTDEWNKIQTRFDYHNRLRNPDYQHIFNESGFDVIYHDCKIPDISSDEYKMFKHIKLSNEYKTYTDNELLASGLIYLLKRRI